jgi:hypothetical protein
MPSPPKLPHLISEGVTSDEATETQLDPLLDRLKDLADTSSKKVLVQIFKGSVAAYGEDRQRKGNPILVPDVHSKLSTHLEDCKSFSLGLYKTLTKTLKPGTASGLLARECHMTPRLSSCLLQRELRHTNMGNIPQEWRKALVAYAESIRAYHLADRLFALVDRPKALLAEYLRSSLPSDVRLSDEEIILAETEQGIMLRSSQHIITGHMISSTLPENSILQMNMAEGKTSVILPLSAALLASGTQLVRVVAGDAQFNQTRARAIAMLGGALFREVHVLPFSRDLHFTPSQVREILDACKRWMIQAAIVIMKP